MPEVPIEGIDDELALVDEDLNAVRPASCHVPTRIWNCLPCVSHAPRTSTCPP
jgi:hypothetical protein